MTGRRRRRQCEIPLDGPFQVTVARPGTGCRKREPGSELSEDVKAFLRELARAEVMAFVAENEKLREKKVDAAARDP